MNPPDAPFAEPWQARAFALVVHLNERGAFSWGDWTAALGAEISRDGIDYWSAWLRALEALLENRVLARREEVAAMAQLWREAARTTPHGQPIELRNPGSEAGGAAVLRGASS